MDSVHRTGTRRSAGRIIQSDACLVYGSMPLRAQGLANISFTIKPNDNHGDWQIDDLCVDPFLFRTVTTLSK